MKVNLNLNLKNREGGLEGEIKFDFGDKEGSLQGVIKFDCNVKTETAIRIVESLRESNFPAMIARILTEKKEANNARTNA